MLEKRYICAIIQMYKNGGGILPFSEDIKKIRESIFMSQTAFSKELGVSYTTVNRWEMEKSIPNYKAMKIIDAYCKNNGIEYDISKSIAEVG